jgi:hypothetical protein
MLSFKGEKFQKQSLQESFEPTGLFKKAKKSSFYFRSILRERLFF